MYMAYSSQSTHKWYGVCMCMNLREDLVCTVVSGTSGIVFKPSACAITDHSQSANEIAHISSPSSMWRTQATASRYSFYRMGWVNPESESTSEIDVRLGWDSHPQPLDQQSKVVSPKYHRSLNSVSRHHFCWNVAIAAACILCMLIR